MKRDMVAILLDKAILSSLAIIVAQSSGEPTGEGTFEVANP
jgi:hypothetical protein